MESKQVELQGLQLLGLSVREVYLFNGFCILLLPDLNKSFFRHKFVLLDSHFKVINRTISLSPNPLVNLRKAPFELPLLISLGISGQ